MRNEVIDTKIVWAGNGRFYHIYRTRCGILDTLTLCYPIKAGNRSVSKRIPSPLGFLLQKTVEIFADRI